MPVNRYKNIISGIPSVRMSEWANGTDAHGNPLVNWGDNICFGDELGFDKRFNVVDYILPVGDKILRYGSEYGHYSAPVDTPYESLSLPYTIESCIYNEYEVCHPIKVGVVLFNNELLVKKGVVAPGFNMCGGGIQYYHPIFTIKQLVNKGWLHRLEVNEWTPIIMNLDKDIL